MFDEIKQKQSPSYPKTHEVWVIKKEKKVVCLKSLSLGFVYFLSVANFTYPGWYTDQKGAGGGIFQCSGFNNS